MLEFATCTPEASCESTTSFRDKTAAGDVCKTCLPCHDSRDGFRCRMTGARLKRSYRCPSEEALPRFGATLIEKELRAPACPRATDAGTATESEGLGERAVG